MSEDCLDQLGRSGLFLHKIRRKMCMGDADLYKHPKARNIENLPVSSDGVFGVGLEQFLDKCIENKKKSDVLLSALTSGKRKEPPTSSNSYTSNNRGKLQKNPTKPLVPFNQLGKIPKVTVQNRGERNSQNDRQVHFPSSNGKNFRPQKQQQQVWEPKFKVRVWSWTIWAWKS